MKDSGCVGSVRYSVELGEFGWEELATIKPLFIEVSSISQKAFDEITRLGGKVRIVYRSK